MYSIEINLLQARSEYKLDTGTRLSKLRLPAGKVSTLYLGLGAGLLLPAVVGAGSMVLQNHNAQLENKVAEIDAELSRLDIQEQQITKIQEQTNKINGENQALATALNQIRPMSAILQDISDRIPVGVQIENIKQTAPSAPQPSQAAANPTGGIEISGMASSFNDVNDFLLTLQQSPFFKPKDTKIVTAELIDSPISAAGSVSQSATAVPVKPPQFVRYTLQSSLSDVPASELIRELERKGALGLVIRIRTLQAKTSPIGTAIQKTNHSKITVTKDFIPVKEGGELKAATPIYFNWLPTAGITLTPAGSAVLVTVLGLTGFLYLLLKRVMPAGEKYQELEASQPKKQAQVQQKQAGSKQSEKVTTEPAQAKQQQAQPFPLFTNEKTIDALLLDFYRLIESVNAKLSRNDLKAKLKKFVLSNQSVDVITDGSLKPLVDGLKRRMVNIEFEATFEQTESILRNIERMQPLLVVRDHQSTLTLATPSPKGRVVRAAATIITSFQLQVLIPVSPSSKVNSCIIVAV